MGVIAVDFGVVSVQIPGALADLRAGREVDAFVRVAVGAYNARKRSTCRRVVAHAFLDEGLKVRQLKCMGI